MILDSNSSNVWRMIFQKSEKISKYHFSFKSYSNLKYLRIFMDFRPFTNKMYGKNTHRIYNRTVSKILTDSPCCRYNGYLKIQFTVSMLIRQFNV